MAGRKLPVLRPGGGFAYMATAAEIRQLVRANLAKSYGKGSRLDGAVLYTGPSRPHAGTKYVHCHEVSATWTDRYGVVRQRHSLDGNVRGVYSFRRITDHPREMYRQVQTDCLSSRSPSVPRS